jgi:RimJ/RimL family protein N-acetyltransferase
MPRDRDAHLDWKPARIPDRTAIPGETVKLEPLDGKRHGEQLFASAVGHDELWTYLAYGPFPDQAAFTSWLTERAASADPFFYAVVDRGAGGARGMAALMRFDAANGVIEVGNIWFAPKLQRTRQATEAIYLLARHAFELGNRRLEWKCDALNVPSRRAAERFGFTFEGVFRQHIVVKHHNRDTAWFSITDAEWPSRRAAFESWLAPSNFDSNGRQRRSLASFR